MSGFESWVLSYLLNSLWQIPLLFAAGHLAARTMKKAGPEAEHRVWVSVLAMQALLPLSCSLPAQWLRSALAFFAPAHPSGDADVSVVISTGVGLSTRHWPSGLLTAIAIAYVAVSAYFAARFLWRWRKLAALRRNAVELTLTGEAALSWEQCRSRFGNQPVSIASSRRILGPVTLGLSQKLILLPDGMAANLSDADLRTVIAHEFAHIRRNDFLKNLIYELISLPASYHPLLWLTRERIMESREVICDRMAAQITGRNEYARSLLRLASLLVKGPSVRTHHAIGIFDANAFERRLMKLTEKHHEIQGLRRFAIVAACMAFGAATCGTAVALRMHVDAAAASNAGDSTPTTQTLSVPAGEMAGNIVTKVTPKYPEEAKKEKIQGKVLLNAIIGKDGSVEELKVVSGPKELQQSSLDAVRQWTYKPYLVNGNAVEIKTTISVIYSLGN
jgi:TonB family protein